MTDGIAVVTGAGRGLGRALARELLARGVTVAGFGRDRDDLAETGAGAAEGRFHPVLADMGDPAAIARGFAEVDAQGPVTILINNAARYPRRDILDETPASFAETMDVNFGGVLAASHEAIGRMVETGRGRIVNVASMADVAPLPASAAYSVSKGAARVLSRALVADLGDRFPGIVISDWLPGMLATRMGVADGLPPEVAARWGADLALLHDPSLNGTTWEMDRELLPPRGLKGKVKDLLLLRRRQPRRLGSVPGQ